jgi:hypothetical protein
MPEVSRSGAFGFTPNSVVENAKNRDVLAIAANNFCGIVYNHYPPSMKQETHRVMPAMPSNQSPPNKPVTPP